jgi:sialidase-1
MHFTLRETSMEHTHSLKAAAFFRQAALFQAGEGGYSIYRIPGVVATTARTLLVYCEARKFARGDWGTIDLLLKRSTDGGLSWSPPLQMNPIGLIVPRNPAALAQNIGLDTDHTFNNPVAIVDQQPGKVHFIFCAEYSHCFYRQSTDDGLSWSEPLEITAAFAELQPRYAWRVIATGPGHGIQLQRGPHAGRLLVPVWISDGTGGHAHRPSAVATIYSDDGGASWHAGEIVVNHGAHVVNPSESAAVELEDGQVMLNIRNEGAFHRRLVALSPDGISRWSQPEADPALFEPVCAASIQRLSFSPPDDRSRLLFSNPDSHLDGERGPGMVSLPRKNLTVRLSEDEGQTWPVSKVIDRGLAGYSDLSTGPGDLITCAYEGGGMDGDYYASSHLSIAQFNLPWLLD